MSAITVSTSTGLTTPTIQHPGPGAIQGRRPFQPWGTINYYTQDTSTNYNSLQVKLDHRESHGLQMLVAYTFSKFLQFNQSPALGGNTGYEYATSPYDIPQNLAISGSYKLPFGRGRQYLTHANGLVNNTLGGWQIQSHHCAAQRCAVYPDRLV